MKILVIAPTPFFSDRGTHIRILEEALALEKLGHKITIATYHIGKDIRQDAETKIDVRRIQRLLFWYKKLEAGPDWQKIILDIMLIRKAFSLARTQKPGIIHAHLHEGVLIGWLVQKLLFWRKIKLIADFHGSLTGEMVSHAYLKSGWIKKLFEKIEHWIDNRGNYAVTSSWENTEEIKKIRRDGKVETVLDGVNLDYYRHLPEKNELKKKLGFPLDKLIAAYTGALVPNKGTSYLYEAMRQVLSARKDVFFIIGGFPAEEMRQFITENNFGGQVRVVNPLDYFDLPEILSASDIGIDPKDSSTHQASGKILQYMAAGLPVVCFDRPNNRNYLETGGFFSREISGSGIAAVIIYLAGHREKIATMGAFNKEKARELSWLKSAEKIDKTYILAYNKKEYK